MRVAMSGAGMPPNEFIRSRIDARIPRAQLIMRKSKMSRGSMRPNEKIFPENLSQEFAR